MVEEAVAKGYAREDVLLLIGDDLRHLPDVFAACSGDGVASLQCHPRDRGLVVGHRRRILSGVRRVTKLLVVVLLLVACSSPQAGPTRLAAEGPPHVQFEIVRKHAEQFDVELPKRLAGSQQEEAAAAYILGHLQRAGYAARLEAVPVANTVNSTDVIAIPPGDEDPDILVAVGYDTGPQTDDDGAAIGLFLELARALARARPQHSVEFVALGAERSPIGGGYLGSRRLVRLLLDEGQDPFVITLEKVGGTPYGFTAVGNGADALLRGADDVGIEVRAHTKMNAALERDVLGRAEIFDRAGLDQAGVLGTARSVGRVLFDVLRERRA